ncbi:MAG TPA: hypothetical protein VGE21_16315 [Flavobacteriales bacterium]
MILRPLLLCPGLLIGLLAFAQPPASLNQKDAKGLKQGPWERLWAESTQLRYKGRFKNDKPVGRFTYYTVKGQLESVIDHYPTGNAAHARHYHPNGKVMAEGRYAGEAKDSIWNYFDSEGVLRSKESWKAGKKHGEEVTYFTDGKPAEKTHFTDGVQTGLTEQFHPEGSLKYKANYVNGEPEGLMTWYFPNGKKEIEGRMVNGQRDGNWVYYHEDGLIQIQVLYAQGNYIKDKKENGVFKEYFDDEQLKSEVTYKHGKREGRFAEYNNDGRWVEKEVQLGPTGGSRTQTERTLEGQTKKREGTYKNDVLEGEVKEYDEHGKLLRTTVYVNGEARP